MSVVRVAKAARELNISSDTVIKFLEENGVTDVTRNTKLTSDLYSLLQQKYQEDVEKKEEASRIEFFSTEDLKTKNKVKQTKNTSKKTITSIEIPVVNDKKNEKLETKTKNIKALKEEKIEIPKKETKPEIKKEKIEEKTKEVVKKVIPKEVKANEKTKEKIEIPKNEKTKEVVKKVIPKEVKANEKTKEKIEIPKNEKTKEKIEIPKNETKPETKKEKIEEKTKEVIKKVIPKEVKANEKTKEKIEEIKPIEDTKNPVHKSIDKKEIKSKEVVKKVITKEVKVNEKKIDEIDTSKISLRKNLKGLKKVKIIALEPKNKTTAKDKKTNPNKKQIKPNSKLIEEPILKQEVKTKTKKATAPTKSLKIEEEVKTNKPKKEIKTPIIDSKDTKEVKEVSLDKENVIEQNKQILSAEESINSEKINIEPTEDKSQSIKARHSTLQGLKIIGKIELEKKPTPKKDSPPDSTSKKGNKKLTKQDIKPVKKTTKESPEKPLKRKRIKFNKPDQKDNKNVKNKTGQNKTVSKKPIPRPKLSQEDVDKSYKKTLAKVQSEKVRNLRSSSRRYRQEKREQIRTRHEKENTQTEKIINVTEYISVSELANIMEATSNDLIMACLNMGSIVTINHRLDKEIIELLAAEFGFEVAFNTLEEEIDIIEIEEDKQEDLLERSPVVTVMGHVDHGKTSLLDYIRNTNVVSSESGGITQHIGSYEAYTKSERRIIFLDTPGHEAFTSMRARGAKITDVAIIVVAADDGVKPRTLEAISHAQVANIPIVFAINKVDKPTANIDNVKQQLAAQNILVDDWGGKYQCFEVSAKTGKGIDELLEGVLLESDVMELKANPNKKAIGVVIESSLDKGRGYVANLLVEAGTLRVGSIVLSGTNYGKIKAFMNHKGSYLTEAGPSTPVQVLGLNGAPQAGEKFHVLDNEKEAKELANKREQLLREQTVRATKRLTLQEIGDRIAQGNFQELNIILKGDVDGSIEALVGLLLKLSTKEVAIRIVHKAVGAISESDVMLANASNAVIIGFQVRPTPTAKKLAEKEEVEIRLYSIIYGIVDDIKQAIEGLLRPTIEEKIVGQVEVREVFKTKFGKVAGSYVSEGYVRRNSKLRLIRDNVIVYTGFINTLRRVKDDVTEVKFGFECGITIKDFNDIKVGDIIEIYEEVEVKRKLESVG